MTARRVSLVLLGLLLAALTLGPREHVVTVNGIDHVWIYAVSRERRER